MSPFRMRESLWQRFDWLLDSVRGTCTLARNLIGLETLRPEHQERARRLLQAQHAIDRAWVQLRSEIEAASFDHEGHQLTTREAA